MDDEQQAELDRRHQALIERDRIVGLEAEAEAARAHAARLQEQLDVARARLDRKNGRIKALAAQVARLEQSRPESDGTRRLRRRLAHIARLTRRSNAVDEV